jgi:hypothetical protein
VVEDLCGAPLLEHLIHGQDFIDASAIDALIPELADAGG